MLYLLDRPLWRKTFLTKYGKYLFIHEHHIATAERWFDRYGTGVVFTARFIPVVRHAISIPAGIAKMPFLKFVLLTGLAAIPWSILFIYLGMRLGTKWDHIQSVAHTYTTPIMVIAIVLIVLYFVLKKFAQIENGQSNENAFHSSCERRFSMRASIVFSYIEIIP